MKKRQAAGQSQLALDVSGPDRQRWAKAICSAWQSSVDGILEAGRLLIAAKAELAHGEFEQMVEADLPFKGTTARRLMTVARDRRLGKRAYTHVLPPSWYTLYQLTKLSDDEFERRITDGTIRPDMRQNEINKLLRIERVQADETRVLSLRPVAGKFRTLVIDPAWDYEWLSVAGRAKPGYAMQTHEQLLALDVLAWAEPECHLYLWVTNNFMARGCELLARWGFQHRTVITWIKPAPFGLGSYFRNSTEHILFGTLGETTTRPAAASIPTHFESPRLEHSEKPEPFYEIVRSASYPPFGEANQRAPRADFAGLYTPVTEGEEDY